MGGREGEEHWRARERGGKRKREMEVKRRVGLSVCRLQESTHFHWLDGWMCKGEVGGDGVGGWSA